jgi:hypothetical protein
MPPDLDQVGLRLRPLDRDTERLVRQLDLNSPRLKSWRVMWMRIVVVAKERDPGLYFRLVGFPEELPDRKRSPANHQILYRMMVWLSALMARSSSRM